MNFNRRPKRIAGPGFNINVKFDFKQMADSRNNTRPDTQFFPIARSDECYDIKEQELLVTRKENKMVDAHSHVFSSLNGYPGLPILERGSKEQKLNEYRKKILSDVYFIGVALTEYRPDQQGYEQQGSVAQVAGVVTMINESNEIIYPGQTLVMDIQGDPFNRRFTSDKGIPREKRRLVVRPLTKEYMTQLGNDSELIRKCIVGKAYSHARPDERFEMGINIGHEYRIDSAVGANQKADELVRDILKKYDQGAKTYAEGKQAFDELSEAYTTLANASEATEQRAIREIQAAEVRAEDRVTSGLAYLNVQIRDLKQETDGLYVENRRLVGELKRVDKENNEQLQAQQTRDNVIFDIMVAGLLSSNVDEDDLKEIFRTEPRGLELTAEEEIYNRESQIEGIIRRAKELNEAEAQGRDGDSGKDGWSISGLIASAKSFIGLGGTSAVPAGRALETFEADAVKPKARKKRTK